MIAKTREKRLARPESPRLRILIVDENVDTARILGVLCEEMGHECKFAYDGVAALEAARRLQPDVILLDLGLPRMDGFEVARQLRADPAFRDLLIIAVTGFASEEDRQRSREVGIDHHLVKPADPAFIESLLRRRR
jgi:CheY-like chemotaxis protein